MKLERARHLLHEAEFAIVAAIVLVAGLAVIDPSLAVIVAIILVGLFVIIVPLVSILYDEENERPLRR